MTKAVKFTHQMVQSMVIALDDKIEKFYPKAAGRLKPLQVYPIPRGGIPIAYALSALRPIRIVDNPEQADIFVDDIFDSGATCRRYCDQYHGKPFFVGIDKSTTLHKEAMRDAWIVFPWEQTHQGADESATDNITRLLQFVGENPHREGLLETPKRVIKAWKHWASGYDADIASILKVFEDGGEKYDQMVTVKDIPIYSKCEHHLADIFGTATIAYIPNGRIVGLSKLSRVADAFARRLQVQERLTDQIADALDHHLKPKGVGVIIKARHMCMESRGICQQGHYTITSALRGVIKEQPETRAEFMQIAS